MRYPGPGDSMNTQPVTLATAGTTIGTIGTAPRMRQRCGSFVAAHASDVPSTRPMTSEPTASMIVRTSVSPNRDALKAVRYPWASSSRATAWIRHSGTTTR